MKKRKKLTLHNRDEMIRRELITKNEDLAPALVKAKFNKMNASPYAFFRGSNHLFWEDFYNDWRFSLFGGKEGTLTWINGDAHIYNYGAYADHYGEAIYGMDDFDDSIIADYQYDLWRMAISIVLDCRANGRFGDSEQEEALKKFSLAYLQEISQYEADDIHKEVLLNSKTATGILNKFLRKIEEKKSRKKMLRKWTVNHGNHRMFNYELEKLEKISQKEFKSLTDALEDYQNTLSPDFTQLDADHFKVKDIARRLWSGTGSLGLDRFYVLLEGDEDTDNDDIILDVKALDKPPLYYHMNSAEREEYDKTFLHEGEHHAEAFRALAEHPDKYLGWLTYNGKVFSVRERSPFKADFPTDILNNVQDLYFMSEMWGKLLAVRHERASHRLNNDPYLLPKTMKELTENKEKQFIGLLTTLSFLYADCVDQDWKSFLKMQEQKKGS